MRVGLFVPCYVDTLYPGVAAASMRLLRRLGTDVEFARDAACCGQPFLNAGFPSLAAKSGHRCVEALAGYDRIVTPSGSCAHMLRSDLPAILPSASDVGSRVRELGAFVVGELGVTDVGASLEARGYLHIGCQLRKDPDAADAAAKLARSVRGLTLVEPSPRPACCGFGGTFAVKFPELSARIGGRTLEWLGPDGAGGPVDVLISTDSSCLMHLGGLLDRRGPAIRRLHLVEVLAGPEPA